MSRRRLDAIVIGAGLVGSAAALGLVRAGLRVAIVEARAPAPWQAGHQYMHSHGLLRADRLCLARLQELPAIANAGSYVTLPRFEDQRDPTRPAGESH